MRLWFEPSRERRSCYVERRIKQLQLFTESLYSNGCRCLAQDEYVTISNIISYTVYKGRANAALGVCINHVDRFLHSEVWHKGNPKSESASELYRPRDRRLLAKFMPTFADRGVSSSKRGWSPRPYSRLSRYEPLLFLPSSSSTVLTRQSGPRSRTTTSQKICSAGNRTRTSGSVARNPDY
jgi:hypothetical protein